MNRDYVIVCVRHMRGHVLFWGEHTEDNEPRSYGGYTINLDRCEHYTKQELIESEWGFPFYRTNMNWRKQEDFFIKVSDLGKLGRKMTVIYL